MERTILYVISFFIESFVVYQYTSCFFMPRFRIAIRILSLILFYGILFLIAFFWEKTVLNTIAFIIVNGFFFFSQYHLKFFQEILHLFIITTIMGITEAFSYGIISVFAPSFDLNTQTGLALILFTAFSKILFLLIVYFLIIISKKRIIHQNPNDHSAPLLILIPIASVFIIFTFITTGEEPYITGTVKTLITISTFLLLLINLLIFGINQYSQKISREFTDIQLLLQKESDLVKYYEMLLAHHENQGILIHDFKKHLQSIALLNETTSNDAIRSYIQQLLQSSALTESVRICDNKMLNAILCRYKRQCFDKNLSFQADIRSHSVDFLENSSLTSLFCNLLDNAIEAAECVPEGFIELMVQKKTHTPFVVISVINSCPQNPLSHKGKPPLSSKSNKKLHGFGMKSIRKTVKQYGGDLNFYYDDNTGTFHSLITLRDK